MRYSVSALVYPVLCVSNLNEDIRDSNERH